MKVWPTLPKNYSLILRAGQLTLQAIQFKLKLLNKFYFGDCSADYEFQAYWVAKIVRRFEKMNFHSFTHVQNGNNLPTSRNGPLFATGETASEELLRVSAF